MTDDLETLHDRLFPMLLAPLSHKGLAMLKEVHAVTDELTRLKAITTNVRRCPNCHKEVLNGRAVTGTAAEYFEPDEDWGEAAE